MASGATTVVAPAAAATIVLATTGVLTAEGSDVTPVDVRAAGVPSKGRPKSSSRS